MYLDANVLINSISAIAACISGFAAFMSMRLERENRLFEQASKITLEIRRLNDENDLPTLWNKHEIGDQVKYEINDATSNGLLVDIITVQNQSTQPIYQVFLFTMSNRIDDSKDKNINIALHRLRWVETINTGSSSFLIQSDGEAMGGEHGLPAMIFSDAKNNIWYRGMKGKLRKLSKRSLEKILMSYNHVYGPYIQWTGFNDLSEDFAY